MRLCFCLMIMFALFNSLFAQDTITVQPDNKVVTNAAERIKEGPIEEDLIKAVDLSENTLFSIKLNATNFDRYIRITSYSTNLDFVRFTRDKTNAFITFRTLTPGIGKLNFQVDNEVSIIRRYIYTVTVTNSQGTAVMETNAAILDTSKEEKEESASKTANAAADKKTSETSKPSGTKNNNAAVANNNTPAKNNAGTNQTTVMAKTDNNTAANAQSSIIKNTSDKKSDDKKAEAVKKPIDSNPQTVALFNSAEDLKNLKDYNNAINAYSNLIKEYPNSKYSVYSYFRMGDIYNQKKDYNNALDMYKKALESSNANNNEKAAAMYSMGVVKKSENKNEEALNYFNDIMSKYPKTPLYGNAVYEIAQILKQDGRISDAAPLLEKSLKDNAKFSKRPDSILLLAEIYEKGNNNVRDFDKAYQTYNKYLAEYPNSVKAKYANDRKNFLYRNAVNLR